MPQVGPGRGCSARRLRCLESVGRRVMPAPVSSGTRVRSASQRAVKSAASLLGRDFAAVRT